MHILQCHFSLNVTLLFHIIIENLIFFILTFDMLSLQYLELNVGFRCFYKSSHSVSISISLSIPTLLARWVKNYIGVFS